GGAQPGRGEDHGAAVDVLDDRVGEGLGDQVVGVVVQVRAGEGQVAQAVPEPVGELLVEQQFGEDGRGGGDRGDALRADNVSELVDHVGEVVVGAPARGDQLLDPAGVQVDGVQHRAERLGLQAGGV